MAYLPLGGDADRRIIEIYARLNNLQGDLDKLKAQLALEKRNQSIAGNGSGGTGKVAVWSSDFELGASSILTESGGHLTTTGDILPSGSVSSGDGSHRWSDVETLTLHADHLDKAAGSFIDIATNLRATADGGQDLGTGGVRFGRVFANKFQYNTGTNGAFHTSGAGTPEGNVAADIGSTYSNTSGGASTAFYVKESNTPDALHGWVAYGAAGAGGANTSLSNLIATTINQDLIPQGDGTVAGHNLGTSVGPHHWNDLYIVRLLNTGTGNISVASNWLAYAANSYSIGDATHPWSDVWLSQEPSRLYFKQAGTTPSISTGTGAPGTAGVIADVGSLYLQKDGAAGMVLWVKETLSGSSSGWTAVNPSGTSPPGSDKQIVYNNSGGFAADANLTWDYGTHQFQVGGSNAVIYTSGQFWGADGSAATPSYAWQHATDGLHMGFFRQGANSIGIATSSTEWWRIDSNGMLKAVPDNDHDIGQNGLLRPRSLYTATGVYIGTQITSSTPALHTPLIDNSNLSSVNFGDSIQGDVSDTRNCGNDPSSGNRWLNVYGNSFRFTALRGIIHGTAGNPNFGGPPTTQSPGALYLNENGGAGTTLWVKESGVSTDTGWVPAGGAGTTPGSSQQVIFNDGSALGADPDFLWDKVNNFLTVNSTGVGNGVIGTTGANSLIKSAGTIQTGDGSAGVPSYTFGSAQTVGIRKGSGSEMRFITSSADRWIIDSSGFLKGAADNTYDIGTNGIGRPRDLWLGRRLITPLIDNNGVQSVQFADSLEPDLDDTRNCGNDPGIGSAPKRWKNVYALAHRFSQTFGWTQGSVAPGGIPTRGSIYSRTSGGGPFYVYDGAAWVDVLAGSGGANLQLSNLTGTTAVPVNLLPAGSGTIDVGSGIHRFAHGYINDLQMDTPARLISATGTITMDSSVDMMLNAFFVDTMTSHSGGGISIADKIQPTSAGTKDIGTSSSYWRNMFGINLGVTNIVPLTAIAPYVAIGSASSFVYVFMQGLARQLTTVNTGQPVYWQ